MALKPSDKSGVAVWAENAPALPRTPVGVLMIQVKGLPWAGCALTDRAHPPLVLPDFIPLNERQAVDPHNPRCFT